MFMFMLRNISFIKMNNYKTFTGRSDIFQLLTHNQHRITGIRYHTYNGHRQYHLFHENRTCIFYTFAQNRDITLGVICSSNLSRLACDVFSISSQNVSSSISTNVFFLFLHRQNAKLLVKYDRWDRDNWLGWRQWDRDCSVLQLT